MNMARGADSKKPGTHEGRREPAAQRTYTMHGAVDDRTSNPRRGERAAAWRLVLCGAVLFVIAFGARLIVLRDAARLGFFKEPLSDAAVFIDRAEGIAQGDWLGPASFVHAPLYAYFLGGLKMLGIGGPWGIRVVQGLMGSAACIVVFLLGKRLFGLAAGVLAGLLLAIHPAAMFFDAIVQKTSLALLLSVVLLGMWLRCARRPTIPGWLGAGAVLGLLTLTRQNALALILLPLAAIWWGRPDRRRVYWTLALLGGLAATLTPWVVRNRIVTGEWILTTPNLGQNFAMGNHPNATGTYLPFKRGQSSGTREQYAWVAAAERATGLDMSAAEVSDYYLSSALEYVKAHPGAWLVLMGRKLLMVWNAYEAPDTEDFCLYAERSSLLAVLDDFQHFGVLAPLAAAGVALTWSERRRLWLLYGWLIITTVSVAVFVVFARYRFPLVPVLVLFGGAGIVGVTEAVIRRQWTRLATALAIAAATAVLTNWPVHLPRRTQPFSYINHAVALAGQGRFDEALAELDKALALDARNVDALDIKASVMADLGRGEESLRLYREALLYEPQDVRALCGIGGVMLDDGQLEPARQHFQRALAIDPDDLEAMNGLGAVVARRGQYSEAFALFEEILKRDPTYVEAQMNLGNTYLAMGRLEDAIGAYQQALAEEPDYADARYNMGVAEVMRGNLERGITCFREVLRVHPLHQDAQRSLIASLAQAGRPEEARALLERLLEREPGREDLRGMMRQLNADR